MRALSLGIDTRRYTLMAFAIGSALGGVAGTLYAPLTQYIDPVPFNLSLSLDLLMMVIVGGAGFFFGPFLGAMIAVLLPEWLRFTQGYYLMLYAVAVIILLIYSPTGILGILDRYLTERRTKAASALRAGRKIRTGGRAMTAVLEISDIKKNFGGITAVDGVSFDVQEGEILGLIGPNGCGKSTLFNCILGQLTPNGGEVKVDGKVVTGFRPSDLNRLGVSRTFQLLQVFPKLSVRENLILAGQEHQGNMLIAAARPVGRGPEQSRRSDDRLLQARSPRQRTRRRLVLRPAETARRRHGLHGRPAAGVARRARRRRQSDHARRSQGAAGRDQPRAQATFVVIEHNMEFVMSLCSRVVVMAEGKVLAIGTPAEIRANSAVIDAYLGH